NEFAILANEFAIKIDLAAAIFPALNVDHVPMHLAAVPIVGRLIGLAGSKMKRPRNLFVEQNIAHRMEDVRIKAEREFADVTGAGVGIENIVQFLGLVARRL